MKKLQRQSTQRNSVQKQTQSRVSIVSGGSGKNERKSSRDSSGHVTPRSNPDDLDEADLDEADRRSGSKEFPEERVDVAIHGKQAIEEAQTRGAAAAGRMVIYEQHQSKMRAEEDEKQIAQLLETGRIDEYEAQQRITRMQMHKGMTERNDMKLDGLVMAGVNYQTTEGMLEELLSRKSKNYFIRTLLEKTGIGWINDKAFLELQRRKHPKYRHIAPKFAKFINSTRFEMAVGVVMIFNGLCIGVQASLDQTKEYPVMQQLEHFSTAIFVGEIFARCIADGWIWLWNKTNMADTGLIILTGVLPLWFFGPMGIDMNSIRSFSVLRVLRLVRLVRLVRTFKEFRMFWKLVQGLQDSIRLMIWMLVLLLALLYTIGIFAIYWIGRDPNLIEDDFAQYYFGDMAKTTLTLFQTTTLDSWSFVARPLLEKAESPRSVFFIFSFVICFGNLVLMNLCTAVIVNNTFTRSKEDDQANAEVKAAQAKEDIIKLEKLFREIDTDGSGLLSKDEYDVAVQTHPEVKTKFELLDIGINEADEIWDLLDTGSGEISVDQFSDTLRALRGDAKSKDSFTIVRRVLQVNSNISKIEHDLTARIDLLSDVRQECTALHRQFGGALNEFGELVAHLSFCMPEGTAFKKQSDIQNLQHRVKKRREECEAVMEAAKRKEDHERKKMERKTRGWTNENKATNAMSRTNGSMSSMNTTTTSWAPNPGQTPGQTKTAWM